VRHQPVLPLGEVRAEDVGEGADEVDGEAGVASGSAPIAMKITMSVYKV
jgi:hypothetical protein